LDIDEAILQEVCPKLASDFPSIGIKAIVADFEQQFEAIQAEVARRRKGPILFTFLGSTFGGIPHEHQRLAFLQSIRTLFAQQSSGGDHLLLGVDLIGPESRMLAAYDNQPANLFNRNLLKVLNREIGTNFPLDYDAFHREVKWNAKEGRIEVYFRATRAQHIVVPALNKSTTTTSVDIAEGELVRISQSAKFTRVGLEALLRQAGMKLSGWFTDAEGRYALVLANKI